MFLISLCSDAVLLMLDSRLTLMVVYRSLVSVEESVCLCLLGLGMGLGPCWSESCNSCQ